MTQDHRNLGQNLLGLYSTLLLLLGKSVLFLLQVPVPKTVKKLNQEIEYYKIVCNNIRKKNYFINLILTKFRYFVLAYIYLNGCLAIIQHTGLLLRLTCKRVSRACCSAATRLVSSSEMGLDEVCPHRPPPLTFPHASPGTPKITTPTLRRASATACHN